MESTKTRPKNKAKNCFFQCFRPDDVVMDDSLGTRSKTTDPLLTYIAVAEKEGILFPTILSSALSVVKDGGEESGSHRRKKLNDSFLRQALKVALNETSWGKKIINFRRKTNKDNMFRSSSSNLKGEGDKISNTECEITHRTNSNTSSSSHCSPAFTPSSSSSFTTKSSSSSPGTQAWSSSSELYQPRSLPINGIGVEKQKQDVGDSRKGYYGSNMAVCLPLIISIVVLILWGKFCAILCTSIGFFVVPPRRRRPCHEGALSGETEFDSVQYKKKIIMEGLLERRRRSYSRV